MRHFDILYEIGEVSDGAELAELFLERFLKDIDGLDHEVTSVKNDVEGGSVSVTISTKARVTSEWFSNADTAVEA